jgi:hypothetical protein
LDIIATSQDSVSLPIGEYCKDISLEPFDHCDSDLLSHQDFDGWEDKITYHPHKAEEASIEAGVL